MYMYVYRVCVCVSIAPSLGVSLSHVSKSVIVQDRTPNSLLCLLMFSSESVQMLPALNVHDKFWVLYTCIVEAERKSLTSFVRSELYQGFI